MGIYEAVAYALRYWFVFVILAALLGVVIVSITEYRDKKRIISRAHAYVGFLEVLYTQGGNAEPGDRFALRAQSAVGSGSGCDIQLTGNGVMKKHAVIRAGEKACVLAVARANNTQLNGHPVKEEETLKSGDILLVGNTSLRVHLKEGF